MPDFTGRIGRRLRAFFHCQPTETSRSHLKKLEGLPTATSQDVKAIADSGKSAQESPISTQNTQTSAACPNEIPLPESPTIDDLLAEVGIREHEQDQHQPDEAISHDSRGVDGESTSPGDELPDASLDEPVEWTPEQVQAIREANYVAFDREDKTDYTRGPARMVAATDGVVNCTALLLTFDLSRAFQGAMKTQRDYYKAKAAANQKTEALLRFESTLEAQIASHRSHLTISDLDATKKNALEAELSTLELMVDEYKMEHTALQGDLEFKGDMLRKIQATVNAMLEEAWVDAQLLKAEANEQDTPVPEYNLQTEYQAFQRKLREVDASPLLEDTAPLDTSNDHLRTEMTAEEKEKQELAERLHEAVWDSWHRVEAARTEFDRREDARMEEEQARKHATLKGELLIDADETYRAARKAVADAGVGDTTGEEFDEADSEEEDLANGYESSFEQEMIPAVPSLLVTQWLSDVPIPESMIMPDVVDRSGLGEGDEWDATELEVGDCVSHFCDMEIEAARNPHRAKIDEWQKVQRELTAEFAWMRG